MIKKLIFRILCNDFTGSVILFILKSRIADIRYPKFKFDFVGAPVEKKMIASVFWGFYESAEIRFVEKYFKGDIDAVEFGASSGVISSHIVSKFNDKSKRLIAVEANKSLSTTWHTNVESHNTSKISVILLNNAVYYAGDSAKFTLSENTTESKITANNSQGAVHVKSISLSAIINEYSLLDYALFCDIEGGELQVFLNEDTSFKNCQYIFIELHNTYEGTKLYSVADMCILIQQLGFEMIDHHGPVYYFSKKSNSIEISGK